MLCFIDCDYSSSSKRHTPFPSSYSTNSAPIARVRLTTLFANVPPVCELFVGFTPSKTTAARFFKPSPGGGTGIGDLLSFVSLSPYTYTAPRSMRTKRSRLHLVRCDMSTGSIQRTEPKSFRVTLNPRSMRVNVPETLPMVDGLSTTAQSKEYPAFFAFSLSMIALSS